MRQRETLERGAGGTAGGNAGCTYGRRRPEDGVLHEAVRGELASFLAAAQARERPVPRFVARELEAFLRNYPVGDLLSYKGIAEGTENSNFLLHTTTGSYILTLYEKRVEKADLPFFLGLMQHLAHKGISCPLPVDGTDGHVIRTLAGRPAVIITFLEGMWLRKPQVEYMTDHVSGRTADFVGRQETLEDDLRTIFDHLGLAWVELQSVNIDPGRPDYHDVYTPATRDRVAELFAADLAAYGYEF